MEDQLEQIREFMNSAQQFMADSRKLHEDLQCRVEELQKKTDQRIETLQKNTDERLEALTEMVRNFTQRERSPPVLAEIGSSLRGFLKSGSQETSFSSGKNTAMFCGFFYMKPPDRLLEVSERVYVFDSCFSTDSFDEVTYKEYMTGIAAELQGYYPDASFMVFNFREGNRMSKISDILSQYDITVMDYPRQHGNCPVLPLEMINHFLRSSESWLSSEGQENVLLMHCERGAWPVLAFMLAGLLLYRKQYNGEQRTLEMIYKQAPKELIQLLSPLNSQSSQIRYLQYIMSRRSVGPELPPLKAPLVVDCLILENPPLFDSENVFRPLVRIYGQDPEIKYNKSTKLLFSSYYEMDPVKLDIRCLVQGDVVLECVYYCDTKEERMFRVMFHTGFVSSSTLVLSRDEVDIMWGAKDQFPGDFKAEIHFLGVNAVPCAISADA